MHAVERGSFQIWSYSRSRFLGASFKLLFVSLELLQKRFVSKLLLNSVPQLIPVVSELVSRPVSVGATLKGGLCQRSYSRSRQREKPVVAAGWTLLVEESTCVRPAKSAVNTLPRYTFAPSRALCV